MKDAGRRWIAEIVFSSIKKPLTIYRMDLKVEYYRESLSTHDLNVTWRNIEADPLRRDSVSRGQDTYREETFQLVLRNIYWTDKKKLLLFLDDVLLRVPETNLLKTLGDELRTRLTDLDFNNGICHGDSITKEGIFPGIEYPRTPGHEIAGIVDKVGNDVNEWKVGQRVAVGWHGGHCGHCESCLRGDFPDVSYVVPQSTQRLHNTY